MMRESLIGVTVAWVKKFVSTKIAQLYPYVTKKGTQEMFIYLQIGDKHF